MNRCCRFILSFMMAIALNFVTFSAHAAPVANDFFRLGVDKMQRGNYQEAVEDLTQAIQLQNDFAAAYSDRCLGYLQLQDYQNAVADCTRAINFAPSYAEAYLNRGLAHYRQGNYSDAIADNNQAIALKPHDFRAYYNRGITTAMLGHHQQAIADYNVALSIIPHSLPKSADIYNDRGLARLELADLKAAMLDFNKAIRLNANDYRAYFNRACACTRSGDNLGAVRDFSEVIRLNPSMAQAYVNRGVTRHRLGYHEAAIADLQKAAEYFGHQAEKVAYQNTLDLLNTLQKQIPSATEIALI